MNRVPEFRITARSSGLDRQLQSLENNYFPARPEVFLSQNEEVYYLLPEPVTIKSFPVHHDLHQNTPNVRYLEAVEHYFSELLRHIPKVMEGATWGFEPRDPFHPALFQIIERDSRSFLYIARFDLTLRPRISEILSKGTNDETAAYETRYVFITPEIVPINGKLSTKDNYFVEWLFDSTWIGERGRGYYLQGIWMDDSITHFVSRLLFKPGTSFHPFYPIKCRYQSLSASLVFPTPQARIKICQGLEAVLGALEGRFSEIQERLRSMRDSDITRLEEEFREQGVFVDHPFRLPMLAEPALNSFNQKEYLVHESEY